VEVEPPRRCDVAEQPGGVGKQEQGASLLLGGEGRGERRLSAREVAAVEQVLAREVAVELPAVAVLCPDLGADPREKLPPQRGARLGCARTRWPARGAPRRAAPPGPVDAREAVAQGAGLQRLPGACPS
jgi:hypothetical protein